MSYHSPCTEAVALVDHVLTSALKYFVHDLHNDCLWLVRYDDYAHCKYRTPMLEY